MAEEKIFLDEGGVSVSNSRMMYDGQTYAMSGVTSVKSFEKKPSRIGPLVLIVIGLASLAGGKNAIIVALLLLAGGIFWWIKQKAEYSVLLTSASGETKAYASSDKGFVNKIIDAINNAIVHRG
jgi:hypothetical protein